MDHDVVAGQRMTERYLLNELDPGLRDEFEEHYFSCTACAADVQAAALLVEQIENGAIPDTNLRPVPVMPPIQTRSRWLPWLRPAFVIPVMAMLLVVVGYQNLVTYPQMARQLSSPRVLPLAQVNVGTYGDAPALKIHQGQGFLVYTRIPPDAAYSKYRVELYNPAGTLEWSLEIPMSSGQDQYPVYVPGANREAGRYSLKVYGITAAGDRREVGPALFELQIQK
ncbi:MAG: hypothetical protein ABSD75_32600 [Terriglobales bacterium]